MLSASLPPRGILDNGISYCFLTQTILLANYKQVPYGNIILGDYKEAVDIAMYYFFKPYAHISSQEATSIKPMKPFTSAHSFFTTLSC